MPIIVVCLHKFTKSRSNFGIVCIIDFTMTTSKDSKPESPRLDDFSENINRAKQEMVLRFVKDQEALQTSQVDLKIVDDEILDLIDSALVVKGSGEESKLTVSDESPKLDKSSHRPVSREVSSLNSDVDSLSNLPEAVIVPRPPSGRPRTRSTSSRKRSVSSLRRQYSVDSFYSGKDVSSKEDTNEPSSSRDFMLHSSTERTELNSSPTSEEGASSGGNLNASWPQQCLSRKLFVPFRDHSVYATKETPYHYNAPLENFSGIDNHPEAFRPRSSQTFQRVQPAEIISARISSASECERISCDPSSLANPLSYAKNVRKGSRRRTYINFSRLDAQLAFDGPLELEPVHPSELPLYRSNSAASSTAPYTMVHVPPIGREGPAPSSS